MGTPLKMSLAMVAVVILLAASALAAAPATNRGDRLPREIPPLPTSHTTREIEGWTVRVDDRLLNGEAAAVGERAIKLLTARLVTIAVVMPEKPLTRLREVPIQIDLTHGALRRMQYHPSAGWLRANGYDERLAKCVHIPNAGDFLSPFENHRQPSAVLHELAHAYHDRVLGFDDPRIVAAWERFRDSGKYNSVLTSPGPMRKHYGLTDAKEFFAEMTESYLAVNDFYPFVAGELKQAEPEIFNLMADIWGPLPGRDADPPRSATVPSTAPADRPDGPATRPATHPATRAWVNPQPDVPYLPKPTTRPADWVVRHDPVTPNASPEARALLACLYDLCGRYTLTGQHNYAANQGVFTAQARRVSGKTPAVYGTDWGSDRAEIRNRDAIVRELVRRHEQGFIITLTWHAVRPTDDEPATFRQSVQGKLTPEQFEELVTPGTPLYERWRGQVDVIARYLKQLQEHHVPVLFRPYHEMNGDWFWWGARRGERGTKQVYRQIFDRLVRHHGLNNLIWVWNVDRPEREDRQFVDYFPGQEYVDVLSLDSYREFKQSYYDDLNALSDGKPLAIGEVGANLPPLEVFQIQPKWAWYMIWAGMISGTRGARGGPATAPTSGPTSAPTTRPIDLSAYVREPRMLSLEDDVYLRMIVPIRAASGLPATRPLAPSPAGNLDEPKPRGN